MALLIPTSFSSFGDATSSEGPGRKYVLAQFRSTAELDWVMELRHCLRLSELKYAAFKRARPRLRADRRLWGRIQAGIGSATVVVVDSSEYSLSAFFTLWEEKGWSDLARRDEDIEDLIAHMVIARSPLAFLPNRLFEATNSLDAVQIADLAEFVPASIRKQIGMGLRPALIFAARSHAIFDVDALRADTDAATTRDVFTSPFAQLALAEVLSAPRSFDIENPNTLTVLNRASDLIASSLQAQLPSLRASAAALVTESSSRDLDGLQAADLAAGWARDVLETSEPQSLVSQFAHVWVNGRRLSR